ncbi:MAG TPA: hypothetical protein VHG08_00415 [Longimicrobium sp.]|nr:hypothetical protein [Longimicrobium sp.]
MPLLPFDTLLIDSPLSVDQACQRLQQATGPRKWFRWSGMPAHPFEGTVTANEVRIQRGIRYQNSFLPQIHGRIEPRAQGSRLVGTMSLHPAVAVFMMVWFGAALLIGLPAILLALGTGDLSEGVWIALAMPLFAWALCTGAFTVEARLARQQLEALLEGASA